MVPFRLARGMAVTLLLISAVGAWAAGTVCPVANTTVSGDAGLNTVIRSVARTHQIMIAASELAGLAHGTPITGLTYRNQPAQSSAFPPAGVTATYADYTIRVSRAATTLSTMSTTLADNDGPDAVTVRGGPLSIEPLAFPNTGDPTAFGPTIPFTNQYIYTGGDLVVTIRHTGNAQNVSSFMDCITTTGPGYGTRVRAMIGMGFAATVGVESAATIVRLTHGCGPLNCPGDVNGDGQRNGRDVQTFTAAFVECAAAGEMNCATCWSTDVNNDAVVDSADATALVDLLIGGNACQ